MKCYSPFFQLSADEKTFADAAAMITEYYSQGLMIQVTAERIKQLFIQGCMFFVYDTTMTQLLACCGFMIEYPDGMLEFGAWAVHPDHRGKGYGLCAYKLAMSARVAQGKKIIAFANDNSGPIFEKLGATVLPHAQMDPEGFKPCQTCKCNKSSLPIGQKCVDTIYVLKDK